MYRRNLLLVFFMMAVSAIQAQLSMSLQEPPPGIVQKQQLWNITLLYNGNNPITVSIGISLVDVRDNQPVLTALSRPITLTHGVRRLRVADVAPIDYNYFSPSFSRLSETFLPIGNYRACYSVYNGSKNAGEVLAEDCMGVEISPLGPPQLSLPADSSSVTTKNPSFSWLPPVPSVLFSDLNYDLLLVEVRPDQTPNGAIQENLPAYSLHRITNVFTAFPISAKSLDTGKVYAWRIVAKDGETFAAQSDVWTFTVSPERPTHPLPAADQYLELSDNPTVIRTGMINGKTLGLKYYSYDATHEGDIKFLNERGEAIKTSRKTITYGDNFWVFPLDGSFAEGSVYFIEYTDGQQKKHRTSFRISK